MYSKKIVFKINIPLLKLDMGQKYVCYLIQWSIYITKIIYFNISLTLEPFIATFRF